MLTYSITLSVILGIVDGWWRVRNTIRHKISEATGETEQLRQSLTEAHREQRQANTVLHSLSRRSSESVAPAIVTKSFVPYDKSVEHQQYIDDALLIFDTAMGKGNNAASRESMCPNVLSQDRWEKGRDWLVGAKVLVYRTHKTKVWATTNRETARGMLHLYAGRVTTSTPSH